MESISLPSTIELVENSSFKQSNFWQNILKTRKNKPHKKKQNKTSTATVDPQHLKAEVAD